MGLIGVDQYLKCFHCGDDCTSPAIEYDHHSFCCQGCQSVYAILKSNGLTDYYRIESTPGIKNEAVDTHKFAYLDNEEVKLRLLDFSSPELEKVRFNIPGIHCSSCIWLLENLRGLNEGILSSRANLADRELAVDYDPGVLSLRKLVELLAAIGYEPSINLEQRKTDVARLESRKLVLKIAVAGFCFGNIMLLSFPEYLGLDMATDVRLSTWFSRIILILSLPVLFYCAAGYFRSALNGIRQKHLNLDVPISMGIIALAAQSYYEILFSEGSGYLDSLAGLLFLLLIGQWFQYKTYRTLSFSRDFKDYFPLAVTRLDQGVEQVVLVERLAPGDIISIRNEELVPADSILLDQVAAIDYSFVSGESQPVTRYQGDRIFAGGRHQGGKARYQVIKEVSQSYLTQLWNHQAFRKSKEDSRSLFINVISQYFTVVVLSLAIIASLFWWFFAPEKSLFVFTSVLIVACPCALAMATPFTLGHTLRVFGSNGLYLKNAQVVDHLAKINSIIFDKTGTLTESISKMTFVGTVDHYQASLIAALASHSVHPVSRSIVVYLNSHFHLDTPLPDLSNFRETRGKGISAVIGQQLVQLGNREFLGLGSEHAAGSTFVAIDHRVIGHFTYEPELRKGLVELLDKLGSTFKLTLLSGDNAHQREQLKKVIPSISLWQFNQTPLEKLQFVGKEQQKGDRVMMVGDGLNDAGALQASKVGLAVADNPQQFTPACDGILRASSFEKLYLFIRLAQWSQWIIGLGIILSFLYNVVGLSFAVSGNLTPLVAAILMPVSSISVVLFTTLAVRFTALRLKLR